MNSLDKDYQALLQDILDNGVTKQDRTGTGTISVFGRQIRHNMKDGFPLLTTKKMPFKTIVTELLWFLRGDTNIKYLVDNNCHIWDGDAYKNYESNWLKENPPFAGPYTDPCLTMEEFINKIKTDDEFAKEWGELGPIYGKQWRKWETYDNEKSPYLDVDQIQNLINELKTNPDSRRLMVNAWNVGELDQMVLPPCHYGFQVYTRELSLEERDDLFDKQYKLFDKKGLEYEIEINKNLPTRAISLMWNQRSVDTFLGLPFNIASYGLLLEILAKTVNMVPDQLIGNLGDVHLYSNHVDQAKEQIGRGLNLIERVNYGVDVLGYEGLLDYGHSQNEDELIIELCDKYGIPKRTREPFPLPTLKVRENLPEHGNEDIDSIPWYSNTDFTVENYQSHPAIKAPLSN